MKWRGAGRPWKRPGAARGRTAPRGVIIGGGRHLGPCAVVFFLAALALAGCAALGAAFNTGSALQDAGYQNASVNIRYGSGYPPGGLVDVSYRSGPTGNDQQDARHAERIVWDTFNYRFGALAIIKVSGGCAGPACVSSSTEIASASYAQLAAQFGPRPRSTASGAGAFSVPTWIRAVAVALLVAFLAAAVIVIVLIVRRRRPAASH